MSRFRYLAEGLVVLASVIVLAMLPSPARACPFCAAVAQTFGEEINNSDAAVLAKLVHMADRSRPPKFSDPNASPEQAKFEIVEILKGDKVLAGTKTFETVYFGDKPVGSTFLVMAVDPAKLAWSTPVPMTDRGRVYLARMLRLPKEGPERLAFFQEYFEDGDEMLARDAYDEFAKVPFGGIRDMKGQMKHDKLVEWIKNPQVSASRRRLYLTMLSVCGTPADAEMLEERIKSKDPQAKSALDALVAAYLTLKGPEGMPLVEDLFLKDKDAEYTDTYAAVMALRFHGQEETVVPKERLLQGLRYMLDRPQLADLVIPDLARWQDWSAMDKLVGLFKNANEESSWVRVPVINYLRACPLPEAKKHLEDLAKLDPEATKQASAFQAFGAAAARPAAAAPSGASAGNPADKSPSGSASTGGDVKPSASAGAEKRIDSVPGKASANQGVNPARAKKDRGSAPVKSSRIDSQGKPLDASPVERRVAGLPMASLAPGARISRAPGSDASTVQVLAAMAGAGVVLLIAFLMILRFGRRTAIGWPAAENGL